VALLSPIANEDRGAVLICLHDFLVNIHGNFLAYYTVKNHVAPGSHA
jgi:hypothetical protein